MSRQTPSIRFLVLGGILSLLLHGTAGLFLGGWSLRKPTIPPAPLLNEPEARRPVEQRLGLEKSRNVTINWLGFEQPTEHSAPEADVEQAELTREPTGTPAETPAPSPPRETAQQQPEEPSETKTAHPAATPAAVVEATAGAVAAAGEWLVRLPTEVAKLAAMIDPPAPQPVEPDAPSEPPTEHTPTVASPTPSPAPTGDDGLASQKDADATAFEQTLEVRPGQPAAAEGLQINTVRPRWRYTTLLTASPRNPTVLITFGRDGRVKRAEFAVRGGKVLHSGERDVDEPLLNAIYQWTAAGKAIEALPEPRPDEDPDSTGGLTVTIRIMLRG